MKISSRIKMLAVLSAALVLSGCSKARNTDDGSKHIMATFYPLYIMLENITEGASNVTLSMLAPPTTGCLHDYQLTTRDMKNIEDCDILVANGLGMEDFIDKVMDIKKDSTIIAGEGYPAVNDNAHIWVSPEGAIYEVEQIAEGLECLDKDNADIYQRNAEAYIARLESLAQEMHEKLDKYEGTKVITFHEAFPYFASEFKLDTVAVIERDAGTEPSAKELNDIVKLIKQVQSEEGRIALFAEPQYSSDAAKVISDETGLEVGELDPAVTGSLDKDSYINAMKNNIKVLEELL